MDNQNNTSNDNITSEARPGESTELDKQSYEIEKLRLEIGFLKRPWWHRSEYLSFFAPTVVAFVSLIIVLNSNIFQAQNSMLEAKKIWLQVEVRNLEELKQTLEDQLAYNNRMLDNMREENLRQKKFLDSMLIFNKTYIQNMRKATESFNNAVVAEKKRIEKYRKK